MPDINDNLKEFTDWIQWFSEVHKREPSLSERESYLFGSINMLLKHNYMLVTERIYSKAKGLM